MGHTPGRVIDVDSRNIFGGREPPVIMEGTPLEPELLKPSNVPEIQLNAEESESS